jgi:hypothetical protein
MGVGNGGPSAPGEGGLGGGGGCDTPGRGLPSGRVRRHGRIYDWSLPQPYHNTADLIALTDNATTAEAYVVGMVLPQEQAEEV